VGNMGFYSRFTDAPHRRSISVCLIPCQRLGSDSTLYNLILFPYTRFNNTIVMGSLAFSILASYPVYWGGKLLVLKYRETFMDRFITSAIKYSHIGDFVIYSIHG